MKLKFVAFGGAALVLAACTDPAAVSNTKPDSPFIKELPEAITSIAAPNQDLTAVRYMPEDGCYWYRHKGPVETTLLPLRNVEGRPICARLPTS